VQEDFDEFENPDDIYEPLLDAMESLVAAELTVTVPHAAAKDKALPIEAVAKEREKEAERARERERAAAAKAQLAAQGNIRCGRSATRARLAAGNVCGCGAARVRVRRNWDGRNHGPSCCLSIASLSTLPKELAADMLAGAWPPCV
jgi:hypothetical protein